MQENEVCSDPLMNAPISKIKAMLVEKYKGSEYAKRARARIREISSIVSIFKRITSPRIQTMDFCH